MHQPLRAIKPEKVSNIFLILEQNDLWIKVKHHVGHNFEVKFKLMLVYDAFVLVVHYTPYYSIVKHHHEDGFLHEEESNDMLCFEL